MVRAPQARACEAFRHRSWFPALPAPTKYKASFRCSCSRNTTLHSENAPSTHHCICSYPPPLPVSPLRALCHASCVMGGPSGLRCRCARPSHQPATLLDRFHLHCPARHRGTRAPTSTPLTPLLPQALAHSLDAQRAPLTCEVAIDTPHDSSKPP